MIINNHKEEELKKHLILLRAEILSLERPFVTNESGFGDPDARQKELDAIQFKKDEEARTYRDLNGIEMKKLKERSSIAGWFSAIAAILSVLTAILTFLFHSNT